MLNPLLAAYVDELAALERQKAELLAGAQKNGFTGSIILEIVRRRMLTPEQRRDEEIIFDIYLEAIGGA